MEPLNPYEIQALMESFTNGSILAPIGSLFMDTENGNHVLVLMYANSEDYSPLIVYQDLVDTMAHTMSANNFINSGRFFPIGHVWDRSDV